MNVLLWILQVGLALHTAAGAAFKLTHSPAQTMPSLRAIPPGVWTAMIGLELVCCLCLVVPAFSKRLGFLVPLAAGFVVVEMLAISGLHLASGAKAYGPLGYWLVVAAVCAFIAYGRARLRPI